MMPAPNARGDGIEDDPAIAVSPRNVRPGWIRVAYHVHTEFSYDCKTSLHAVLEQATLAGFRSLCITDHDTIDGAIALKRFGDRDIEIVVGCEFTAKDGSHVIGLDLKEMISEKRVPHLLERIHQQGGLVVLPHPFRRGSGIFRNEMKRSDEFVREVLSSTDIVECFNGGDNYTNNQRSFAFAEERGVPAVAGSDAHTAAQIGSVFVEYAEGDQIHGTSPRRIFFPTQRPATENPLKTRLMELYHRHEANLPAVFGSAYRISRKRLGNDARRRTGAPPRMQCELPRARSGAPHD